MTDRIEPGAHEIPWPGRRVSSGDTIPGAGTWEIVDHTGCDGHGHLEALTPGAPAPRCRVCGEPVTWQLTHLAPSVAVDHRNVGRLP